MRLAPWPIVSNYSLELDPSVLKGIADLAMSLQSDEPALAEREPLGPGIRCGWRAVPTLYFEDHSSIQLQSFNDARYFEYRSFALSSANDIYLRSSGRSTAFERYQREYLNRGADTVLTVDMRKVESISLAKACLGQKDHINYLASRARVAGGLNICPFLVTDDVWLLAAEVQRLSDSQIKVVGPTARLATQANDKLWFSQMAKQVLGREHLPVTCQAYTVGAAAAELRYLAGRALRVVLKTPSSAGSLGNFIFNSQAILAQSEDEFRQEVEARLLSSGVSCAGPFLTATWENPVQSSPSAQVWIPSEADGLPIIEGMFTQTLEGANARFSGAQPAVMSLPLQQQMVTEAGCLAYCLQQLGYFGRVSFDAILLGDDPPQAELHWIECNARWGGVSIPMTVAHQIARAQGVAMPDMRVVQKPFSTFSVDGFDTFTDSLGADLLDVQALSSGIVCLTPIGEANTCACLLIMASGDEAALELAEKALGKLNGNETLSLSKP